MPRDLPIGNGDLLVTFDSHYRLRDFYYPHVGQENHAGQRPFHFGVWADDRLTWMDAEGWTRQLDYDDDTLATDVRLTHPGLGLELHCGDVVDFHLSIYLREILVRNLRPEARSVRLYFHHDFNILGNDVGDTAYFDPATRALIHYKSDRYFLVNCCGPDACGIRDFATGIKNRPGLEGTFRDAEDGRLSGNPVSQGSVDSTIEIEIPLPASGENRAHYWIIAAHTYDAVLKLDRMVLERTPEEFIRRTRNYWHCWLHKEEWQLEALPPAVARAFKRSLLVLRTQVDNHGPILAANDTDYLHFSRDTYSYCWPRDGALVCRALDLAGHGEMSQHFFRFCAEVIRPGGYLMHKYNPDGTVASSWHPWIGAASRLPIQEDETALVLWSLWQHYDRYRDIEFIRPLYRDLIVNSADFLESYRDPATGLPLPSWDLWEERDGIHAFTCGAVYGGLDAARRFADMFGQTDKAKQYGAACETLREAIARHLYCPEENRFARALLPVNGRLVHDRTLDAAILGLWRFGAFAAEDPRMRQTAEQLRRGLTARTAIGGMARYEQDPYFRVSSDLSRATGNPWFVSTLWDAQYRMALCAREEDLQREVQPILEWVAARALPSGVLAEQIHPETGEPLSVSPLTWSHAAYVETVMEYLDRLADLRRCPTCGLSVFRYSRSGRR